MKIITARWWSSVQIGSSILFCFIVLFDCSADLSHWIFILFLSYFFNYLLFRFRSVLLLAPQLVSITTSTPCAWFKAA